MSVKTNWDEFETNKEILKEIRKSFDEKTNYILFYLQVVLQNDKNTLSILENLKKKSIEYYIIEMEFLDKKDELESKINEINSNWKDLETTYQKELKKRHDEYQRGQTNKKRAIYLMQLKKLLFQLKIKNLIYEDIYQHYEQNIFYCQNNKYEQFYNSYF
jgi:hypothetical protein